MARVKGGAKGARIGGEQRAKGGGKRQYQGAKKGSIKAQKRAPLLREPLVFARLASLCRKRSSALNTAPWLGRGYRRSWTESALLWGCQEYQCAPRWNPKHESGLQARVSAEHPSVQGYKRKGRGANKEGVFAGVHYKAFLRMI